MPTEDAYSSGHLVLSHLGFADTYSCPFPWLDHLPNLILLNISFHRPSATGVACQHGTFTPPHIWSCPTLGLESVVMLRPISLELVLFPDFWLSNIPRYFCFASVVDLTWRKENERYIRMLKKGVINSWLVAKICVKSTFILAHAYWPQ